MTKICSKCSETKDVSLFYKKTAYRPTEDGYDYYCKICRNAAAKKAYTSNKVKCSAEGCDKPNYARHLCKCCYHKLLRREKKEKK
jgi:hypothetical protein